MTEVPSGEPGVSCPTSDDSAVSSAVLGVVSGLALGFIGSLSVARTSSQSGKAHA